MGLKLFNPIVGKDAPESRPIDHGDVSSCSGANHLIALVLRVVKMRTWLCNRASGPPQGVRMFTNLVEKKLSGKNFSLKTSWDELMMSL